MGSNSFEYYNWGKVIKSTDNNYIALGLVWGGSKTVFGSNFHGASDIWMVKFDTSGNIIWKRCWGGSTYDYAMTFIQNSDGSLVIAGGTNSQDGDLLGSGKNTGGEDTWIFKLFPDDFLSVNDFNDNDREGLKIYPNPTSDLVYIDTNTKIEKIEIFTLNGQLVKSSNERIIDLKTFATGVYLLKIKTPKGIKIHKIIKE